jgi:hypothetical protein
MASRSSSSVLNRYRYFVFVGAISELSSFTEVCYDKRNCDRNFGAFTAVMIQVEVYHNTIRHHNPEDVNFRSDKFG